MDPIARNPDLATPVKEHYGFKAKQTENTNPNIGRSSPVFQSASSPLVKSARGQKSASKSAKLLDQKVVIFSPMKKIRERKFVVAKKKKNPTAADSKEQGTEVLSAECKCREKLEGNNHPRKCLCVAYESLRASQEEFFNHRSMEKESKSGSEDVVKVIGPMTEFDGNLVSADEGDRQNETSSPTTKRRKDKFLEEARNNLPKLGKVKHLVKAFEEMLTVNAADGENNLVGEETVDEEKRKLMVWSLPGLNTASQAHDPDVVSCSTFSPSHLFLTSENLGLDSRYSSSSSWDGSQARTSIGGRKSRRNSSGSCGIVVAANRRRNKPSKITSLKPFKLRTEERGKLKEEEFSKKLLAKLIEEEKQRIPIAQGLPWTTDEAECLVKPLVKESTRPLDLKLHTDVRAVERAEFDHQIAEKLSIIEQYKKEREREQKMIEEDEVRQLRKELIPKAQPMPYFDRPFIPRRSTKNLTVPKEPKFHYPEHKIKCCLSLDDLTSYTSEQ